METGYKVLNLRVDSENATNDAFKVLRELRPDWKEDDVVLEVLGGGTLNKTIKAVHAKNPDEGIIIRVNGAISEKAGVSRKDEVRFLRHLNTHGVGMPLLASFDNGIVSKLLPGKSFDGKMLRDITLACKVAKLLAGIHYPTLEDCDRKASAEYNSSVMVLAKTSIKLIRELMDTRSVKYFLTQVNLDEVDKELDVLYEELESLGMPMVLSHNDIWTENLLYDEKSDLVSLIDYEMAGFNYLPFDLASYFFCIEGDPPSITEKLTPDLAKCMIKVYLEETAKLNGLPATSITDNEVEKYFIWSCKCMLLFSLFNVPYIFCIGHCLDEEGPPNMFDRMSIGMYKEYKRMKEEYSKIKL